MRKFGILSIALAAFFVISCNNSSKHESQGEETIELNNGSKWNVNAEMKPFILDAEKILQQSNAKDYKELADELDDKNKSLINSCTMTGKSHDELHKWLHPHMQLIKELKNANDQDQANNIIKELELSFESYHKYFQ